jgi:hypothetical protein
MTRNERTAIKRNVSVLLEQLGGTSEAVATSLRQAGVQGDPFLVSRCPLARYLHAVVGVEPRVGKIKVGLYKAVINGPRWWQPMTIDLPAPVRGFVVDFDRGRFPDLLRRAKGRPVPGASANNTSVRAPS